MTEKADFVVVGLGAMGSAVLYQLAKRGVDVIGVDRFAPPHRMGSSHGETRITRQAVGEGGDYAPLVLNSHRIWRELETDTGEKLLNACGVLVMGPGSGQTSHHGKPDFVVRSIDVAREFGSNTRSSTAPKSVAVFLNSWGSQATRRPTSNPAAATSFRNAASLRS